MREQYMIFLDHKSEIETFIKNNISGLYDISKGKDDNFKELFDLFRSLELVYYCKYDKQNNSLTQISDNIFATKTKINNNNNKNYLIDKFDIDNNGFELSDPYISSSSGEVCITVYIKEANEIYVLDFNLSIILQRLGLVEIHPMFTSSVKLFYLASGVVLSFFAMFAIFYSLYEFFTFFMASKKLSIDFIFKPVITLTLGIAIFDLAKTVLEQEVVFKKHSNSESNDSRILTKFSTTIIIALLIESLMVVFKMAFDNSEHMIQAFYLICGVSFLILSLGIFIAVSKYKAKP